MMQTITLTVEPLTEEAFAPFGQLIGPRGGTPDFEGQGLRSWRLAYDAVGPTDIMYIWFDYIPMQFTRLERHLNVTQGFIPLNGTEMVMVVGPRTDLGSRDAGPDPHQLRAFLVPGTHGVMMWRGVWHTLNRFPTSPPGGGFVLLTSSETQAELEHQRLHGSLPELTHVVDYESLSGKRFEIRM